MGDILIAEDSATQAMHIRMLLKGAGYESRSVTNGVDALRSIAEQPPLALLTDLDMPEMNGLDLVVAVRREYPHVPVILMTAFGSEEIAIEALQAGAASYVPKKNLEHDLVHTLHDVLEVARSVREDARLAEHLTGLEARFELTSLATPIMAIVGYVQDGMSQLKLGDENDRLRLGVALDAAIQNAMYFGNLEFTPQQLLETANLGDGGKALSRLLHERSNSEPYCDRKVDVDVNISPQEVRCVVRHEGRGFDAKAALESDDRLELQNGGGRGWLLVKSLMHEIVFNANGDEITLSKRFGI